MLKFQHEANIVTGTGKVESEFRLLAARLVIEQAALAAFAPLVPAEATVRANDPMTGNNHRDFVRRTRTGNGAGGVGSPDRGCDLRV